MWVPVPELVTFIFSFLCGAAPSRVEMGVPGAGRGAGAPLRSRGMSEGSHVI